MKLQNELNPLIERLQKIADKIPPYAQELQASGNFKNFEIRLAWDCLKAVTSTTTICDWYDKYNCNDTHITTLAKAALKSVYHF